MTPSPSRNIRVPDHLWQAARRRAESEGRTVSAVIVHALNHYVQHGWTTTTNDTSQDAP